MIEYTGYINIVAEANVNKRGKINIWHKTLPKEFIIGLKYSVES